MKGDSYSAPFAMIQGLLGRRNAMMQSSMVMLCLYTCVQILMQSDCFRQVGKSL